jgi:hypothetical protein
MSLNFAVWSPFYRDLSLRSKSHVQGVPSGKNGSQLAGSWEANRKASGTRPDKSQNI